MQRTHWACLLLSVCLSLPGLAAAETTYRAEYNAQNGQALITLEDILPAIKTAGEEGWTRVDAEGFRTLRTTEPDRPDLPCLEYWISVPAGSQFLELMVKADRSESTLPGRIKPVRKPYIPEPGVVPPPLAADASVYQSAEEYPAAWSEQEFFRAGSTTILRLKVFLYKYIGTEKKLVSYRNPKLQVRLAAPGWQPAPEPKNAVDRELRRKLVNPDEAFFRQPLR
ncbi:MAG: hypothetical protein AB1439_08155 [candidate division FCPU426 bacterium]